MWWASSARVLPVPNSSPAGIAVRRALVIDRLLLSNLLVCQFHRVLISGVHQKLRAAQNVGVIFAARRGIEASDVARYCVRTIEHWNLQRSEVCAIARNLGRQANSHPHANVSCLHAAAHINAVAEDWHGTNYDGTAAPGSQFQRSAPTSSELPVCSGPVSSLYRARCRRNILKM